MHPATGLLLAYLAGSFPSAYLAGRLLRGVDLRTLGSGNLGATNVYRNLGPSAAIVVLLFDAGKGALPVYLLPRLFDVGGAGSDAAEWWALAYCFAAIAGHAKPVFLLWKGGGKGVATASGAFALLVPYAVLWTTLLFAAVAWRSGYASAGSVSAALVFPLLVWLERGVSPVLWASVVVSVFIVWTHRTNLQRLRAGTESRLFQNAERQS